MKKKEDQIDKFLAIEMKKIDIDKWCEGISSKTDPGQEYVIDWISKNAKWFRESWNNSCCKRCIKWKQCGFEVKRECESFIKELDMAYINDKVCYIDCLCEDSNHAIRIYYDNEYKVFSFQFKVQRFPRDISFKTYKLMSLKDKLNYFINENCWKIKQWFKYVWLAAWGKPVYFNFNTELTYDEAYRMSEFLKEKLPV